MGYYDEYNRKAQTTIVVNTGNAGSVYWSEKEFWSSDACFALYPNKQLIDKFVFYVVSSQESKIKTKIRTGAMPTIDATAVKNLKIPVPSLPVQQSIVDTLDKLDAYCNDMTVGLPAEIKARQEQYEYYREKLLTFKEKVA